MSDEFILACDLATVTGWACGAPGDRPIWGHRRNGWPGAPVGAVLADFADWLEGMIDKLMPSRLYYEAPYLSRQITNPATVLILYGLQAHFLTIAHRRDLVAVKVYIKTAAKHFVGSGGLRRDEKKKATIAMCETYGWKVADDNEADALAIFTYAEAQVDPTVRRASGPLWAQEERDAV